jgi:hypothetical protein
MLLVEPRGQSHSGLQSEDWWLGVSRRFMRPEEGGIAVVSRTPGPGLVGVFAAGLPRRTQLPLPRMEVKRWMGVAKVFTVALKGVESHANMGFSSFLHFPLHLEAAATLATMTLHASSRWGFRHVG